MIGTMLDTYLCLRGLFILCISVKSGAVPVGRGGGHPVNSVIDLVPRILSIWPLDNS